MDMDQKEFLLLSSVSVGYRGVFQVTYFQRHLHTYFTSQPTCQHMLLACNYSPGVEQADSAPIELCGSRKGLLGLLCVEIEAGIWMC